MFPTHTTRRQQRTPTNHSPSQGSLNYQHTPITSSYSIQYPGHTVPGYAYPSKYGGIGSVQTTPIERTSYPQWTSARIQGYDLDGSQNGNNNCLDGSQHSQHSHHSHSDGHEGGGYYDQAQSPPGAPQSENHQPDPYERYQKYQYQQNPSSQDETEASNEGETIDQSTHYSYPSSRSQSNRYYSQDAPVDYQPYIPERVPRSVGAMHQQNGTAPYTKWTPPARFQQFVASDGQQAPQQQQYTDSYSSSSYPGGGGGEEEIVINETFDEQQDEGPTGAHIDTTYPSSSYSSQQSVTENVTHEQKLYPGQPGYKWTPPAVLQAFQASPLQSPQPSQPSSKYALHSHNHLATHLATETIPTTTPPSHAPSSLSVPHQSWKGCSPPSSLPSPSPYLSSFPPLSSLQTPPRSIMNLLNGQSFNQVNK
jgi:hypothetical protein